MPFNIRQFGGASPYDYSGFLTSQNSQVSTPGNFSQTGGMPGVGGGTGGNPAWGNASTQGMMGAMFNQPAPAQPYSPQFGGQYTSYGGRQVQMPKWWHPGMRNVQFRPGAQEQRPGYRSAAIVDPNARQLPASPSPMPGGPGGPGDGGMGDGGMGGGDGGGMFGNTGPIHGPQISPYEPLGALTAPPPTWAGLSSLGPGTGMSQGGAQQNFQDINKSNFYPAAFDAYQQGRTLDAALGFDRDLARAQTDNRYGALGVQQMANQLLRAQPGLSFLGSQIALPLQLVGQGFF